MPEVALEYIDADLVPGRQVYAVVVRFGVELLKNSVLCFFCFFGSSHWLAPFWAAMPPPFALLVKRSEVIVLKFVAHTPAVKSYIVPVCCVVYRGAVGFPDFSESPVSVYFVDWSRPVYSYFFFSEAVPFVKQAFCFIVGQFLCSGCLCELIIIALAHIFGVVVWFPFLFAF